MFHVTFLSLTEVGAIAGFLGGCLILVMTTRQTLAKDNKKSLKKWQG
jgi:hypothetical protein